MVMLVQCGIQWDKRNPCRGCDVTLATLIILLLPALFPVALWLRWDVATAVREVLPCKCTTLGLWCGIDSPHHILEVATTVSEMFLYKHYTFTFFSQCPSSGSSQTSGYQFRSLVLHVLFCFSTIREYLASHCPSHWPSVKMINHSATL